ncbi:BGN_3a_G0017550.mRNA.1.CDS.1 [Saccharomyces cerevisiae]|nr:BGN_3a_G0017550.mRNA.1.CDS.1 [Saccharomyces cerevisiae]CAI7111169.1 BGN_3a_G0017550.mRNA.1.CDS.1 [Saccharomyces cerevisiae]
MRSDGSDYASTDNYELTATFTGPRSTTTSPELITLSALIGVNSMQETHLLFKNNATFFNDIYVLEGTCGTDVVSLKNFSP